MNREKDGRERVARLPPVPHFFVTAISRLLSSGS